MNTLGTGASGLRYHGRDLSKGIEIGIGKATSRPATILEAGAVVPHEEMDHHTSAVRLAER
jgi:hypothetical protein